MVYGDENLHVKQLGAKFGSNHYPYIRVWLPVASSHFGGRGEGGERWMNRRPEQGNKEPRPKRRREGFWRNFRNFTCKFEHFGAFLEQFLQRVSIACYAKRCISYRKSVRLSVRLSVCQSLALCQNYSSYDHAVFTGG